MGNGKLFGRTGDKAAGNASGRKSPSKKKHKKNMSSSRRRAAFSFLDTSEVALEGGKNPFTRFVRKNLLYELSFLISLIMFLVLCIACKLTPFGNCTLLVVDSLHQYLPFYSDYYDVLKGDGDFFYNWNGGMGFNFITLWAYYLSSPFLLLIFFFPKSMINTALTIIVGLKICLASTTMTYAISKYFNTRDIKILFFGFAYGYSNYVMGYYWNNMWLDVLIMLPLAILGLKYLIDKGDARLYIVSLFLAFVGNFYIAYMMCIFLVIWFLIYPHKSVKSFFTSGFKFAISSIVSAGMGAFFMIPTFKGLMQTGEGDSTFPKFSWYGDLLDEFRSLLFNQEAFTNQADDGQVNLYCGLLAVFLGVLYFGVKEISIPQKIKHFLLIAFFFVSFDNNVLNYIWHGFHDQYGIPNRFSFLFIFVLLFMGYEAVSHYEYINFFCFFIPLILLIGFALWQGSDDPPIVDNAETIVRWIYILYAGYFMLFMLNIMLEWKPMVLAVILTVVAIGEVGYNAFTTFYADGKPDMDGYFNENQDVWSAADSVAESDSSLYREELSKTRLVDENFYYNLKSVGVFGSTANGESVTFLNKLGFYTAANEHLYNGATPLTDALLGVKYLYFRTGDYFDHGFDYYETVDGVDIFKNSYALCPAGYMVNDLEDWDYTYYDPTDNLNGFCTTATDVDENLFEKLPDDFECSAVGAETASLGNGDGTYSYTKTGDDGGNFSVTLTLTAKDDRPIYFRATGTDLSGIQVCVNDSVMCDGRYFFCLVPVGETQAGDKITVTYTFNGDEADDQTVNLTAYAWNQSVFDEVYSQLSDEQLQVTDYTSSTVSGVIDVKEDGMMMTSIVDEDGWKLYVDGEEAEITDIGGSFIGTYLTKGSHTIKLKFVPKTFPLGMAVSIVSLILVILYFIKYPFKGRLKKAESGAQGADAGDSEVEAVFDEYKDYKEDVSNETE